MNLDHIWQPHATLPYLVLQDVKDALVRTEKMPNGFYLWQFRTTAGYSESVDAAKHAVEAAAEFFDVMRRNPYL